MADDCRWCIVCGRSPDYLPEKGDELGSCVTCGRCVCEPCQPSHDEGCDKARKIVPADVTPEELGRRWSEEAFASVNAEQAHR